MQYITSTDARNSLSKAIDMARREPVIVQKQGRDAAVILSPEDFDRITRDNIEDFLEFCDMIGKRAESSGLTEKKLTDLLKSKD